MQLKQRIKRLAAFLLAMSMALGCMPGSAWAETATPTDLIATSGEALPDTTLPSATPEPEEESGVPGTEPSEMPNAPGSDTELADTPSAGQEESTEETTKESTESAAEGEDQEARYHMLQGTIVKMEAEGSVFTLQADDGNSYDIALTDIRDVEVELAQDTQIAIAYIGEALG